jgi:hypothetical protein
LTQLIKGFGRSAPWTFGDVAGGFSFLPHSAEDTTLTATDSL